MNEITDILDQIEAYCTARGIKHSTFGQAVLKDRNMVERLKSGEQAIRSKIEKIQTYIADNPPDQETAE